MGPNGLVAIDVHVHPMSVQDKCLFGSDWPFLTPERRPADFAALMVKDAVRPKVLRDNARRLFLGPPSTGS